jgi:hypothetical protein
MQNPHSISDAADPLVERLGLNIVDDPFHQSGLWDRLPLIIELHQRRRVFGYFYVGAFWGAGSPDGVAPLQTAQELRQVMHAASGESWMKCLVHIDRGTAKVDIHFDYRGTLWTPDMADPDAFATGLRHWHPGRPSLAGLA